MRLGFCFGERGQRGGSGPYCAVLSWAGLTAALRRVLEKEVSCWRWSGSVCFPVFSLPRCSATIGLGSTHHPNGPRG